MIPVRGAVSDSEQPVNQTARDPTDTEMSGLLRAWSDGDRAALDRLTPIVYDELHRLASRYMRGERPGHSLQTTALVNEAYMAMRQLHAHYGILNSCNSGCTPSAEREDPT